MLKVVSSSHLDAEKVEIRAEPPSVRRKSHRAERESVRGTRTAVLERYIQGDVFQGHPPEARFHRQGQVHARIGGGFGKIWRRRKRQTKGELLAAEKDGRTHGHVRLQPSKRYFLVGEKAVTEGEHEGQGDGIAFALEDIWTWNRNTVH